MSRTNFEKWGLCEGESPVDTFWAGVVDKRRSGAAKFARGMGGVLLPRGLRSAVMKPDQSFTFTVTNRAALVIVGLTVHPLRLLSGDFELVDTGLRTSMRAVVAGRLAAVELTAPGFVNPFLLIQEASLKHLVRLCV